MYGLCTNEKLDWSQISANTHGLCVIENLILLPHIRECVVVWYTSLIQYWFQPSHSIHRMCPVTAHSQYSCECNLPFSFCVVSSLFHSRSQSTGAGRLYSQPRAQVWNVLWRWGEDVCRICRKSGVRGDRCRGLCLMGRGLFEYVQPLFRGNSVLGIWSASAMMALIILQTRNRFAIIMACQNTDYRLSRWRLSKATKH